MEVILVFNSLHVFDYGFSGITQHIGAFVVSLNEKSKCIEDLVVFLDTPGHKAFTSMRKRGSSLTDIVVLVVAADDGVMEQTIESITFAQNSNVPIIVAINKIDKINHDENKILFLKNGLKSYGIVLEEDGGQVQSVRMSALKGEGIQDLKEALVAQAETLELKEYVDGNVRCCVIESCVHPHRGRLATVLVQRGTLKRGDLLVATSTEHNTVSWAKVRSMFNEYGEVVNEATPGFPVQIIGWRDETLPEAGDKVWQLASEKQVKDILKLARDYEKLVKENIDSQVILHKKEEHNKVYKAELLKLREAGIRYKRKRSKVPREKIISTDGDELKISVILKADVNGTLEVLLDLFDSYPNEHYPVKLNLIHYGLGDVNENDIQLASCFPNGMLFTFNTGVFNPSLIKMSKELNVPIKRFNVIYHLVDHLKSVILDKMPFVEREQIIGEATVQQEFVINDKRKKVPVAGSRCTKGVLKKDAFYKLIRNGEIIENGLQLSFMKHYKDDVEEIKRDTECGLMFVNNYIVDNGAHTIRFLPQDTLICYELVKVKQTLNWSPKGF